MLLRCLQAGDTPFMTSHGSLSSVGLSSGLQQYSMLPFVKGSYTFGLVLLLTLISRAPATGTVPHTSQESRGTCLK